MKVEKISNNRVNFHLGGHINAEKMKKLMDELLDATSEMNNGKILYTISDISIPSPAALAVEFTYLPKLFSLLSRLERCAVVTDTTWIAKAADLEGVLIPGLKIKSFKQGEMDAAEDWLTQSQI